ncbi:unnamed protein product [Aphanomyces euteiches]|uniref:Transmembrane protein 65 n=1 Tax=Aphanomyces euteiches TaxID=100861 RepID=A0A6G0WP11_9STRA|nr:hypothetical protein Ae201684_013227 [Aphanomyces euteiches]KAH9064807.1 hypothetical protein Ae201684P_003589 [Aphanomyces euteiches]KAH9133213.1 hypothetical protein AeRB84_020650 [Aphanomyces euteiches]
MIWRACSVVVHLCRRRGLSTVPTNWDAESKRKVLERLSRVPSDDLANIAARIDERAIVYLSSLLPAVSTTTSATVPEPTPLQLRQLMLRSMAPFIGFGFVDNSIMILAGDYIDITLGVSLGISSMAAAGLGNAVSDVAGIGLGGVIESWASQLGLADPKLSQSQRLLRSAQIARYAGSTIGIVIGCLLGMCPLLFIDTKEDKLKE